MTLTKQLRELAEGSSKRHPGKAQEIMQTAIDQLIQESILDNAYKTGNKIPEIELPNALNNIVNVNDLLTENRIVLAFIVVAGVHIVI